MEYLYTCQISPRVARGGTPPPPKYFSLMKNEFWVGKKKRYSFWAPPLLALPGGPWQVGYLPGLCPVR